MENFSGCSPVFLCLSPRETKRSALRNVRSWVEERLEQVPGPEGCWVGCVTALQQDRSHTIPMMNRGFFKRRKSSSQPLKHSL